MALLLPAQSTLGTATGIVTGDDGTPLAGVRIVASSSLTPSPGASRKLPSLAATGAVQSRAISAANGSFTLENLPPGSYTLCAQGSPTHLDPCNWSKIPPEIVVSSNEKKSNVQIRLAKGAILQVRLNDSKNLLNTAGSSVKPYVLIGIATLAGHFYPILTASGNSVGRDQKLLVPMFENFELKVTSRNLTLTDSAQKALPATGYSVPIHIDTAAPQVIAFNITGAQ